LAVTIVTALIVVFTAAFLDPGPGRPSEAETFARTEATPVVVASSPEHPPSLLPPPPRPHVPPEPAEASAAVPLSGRERALLESLDPDLFASLPPRAGPWEEGERPPCFADDASASRRCLPDYHVVGAWQSGGQAFNAKLGAHPDVREGAAPHFWNEPDKPTTRYLDLFAARAAEAEPEAEAEGKNINVLRVGDASPGVLANTWTESQRMHRSFAQTAAACWQACQELSDAPIQGASRTPRRRCVDGDGDGDGGGGGCISRAAARDAVVNGSVAAAADRSPRSTPLSVPHLMRHAYGDKSVKIIALVRAPLARLRAAFAHYAHYAKAFGEGEDGFDAFVATFVDEFRRCEADVSAANEESTRRSNVSRTFSARTECAFHFEALGPDREKVFYHCDQLIKTMYGTFARGWVEAFGAANVLFLRTEDAFSANATVRVRALRRATRFLGLEVPTDDVFQRMDAMDACDETKESGCVRAASDATLATLDFGEGVAATRAATRERVDAFFEPETSILAELFGDRDEASSWAAWGRGEATDVGVMGVRV
jgi:N-acetylgalactosamine 4-sulfate 6-O-sulfotransferase